jgi:hypothetical protein
MSEWESFDPARLVLRLPTCPKCGATMWLERIEPDGPGHDKRTPMSNMRERNHRHRKVSLTT